MVNTQLLDEKIADSGLHIGHIVKKIGISRAAFDKKRKGVNKFRVAEIYVLSDLLELSKEDKMAIFDAEEVGE